MALIDFASMRHMRTLATVLTGPTVTMIALATLWTSPTDAAPNCLAQPNLKAADGRHWYYRTDPATHRKCWYIRPKGESVDQAGAREQPAARPIPTPSPRPAQAIWDRMFPLPPPNEAASRVTDTDRPIDTGDHAGTSDRRELPPIAAAFTADETPTAPAVERKNHLALIAVALLLIALAAGAGVKHWRAGRVSGDRRADYLAVLSRAIANGDADDREGRRAIYACARRVLGDRLRAADPPVGEAVVAAEQAALDAAIAQIESQNAYRQKSGPPPLREQADRAFAPRFGSGGKRPSARRRLGEIATWALRASGRA
jgi:hypothetical protein